jgi:hypothetical protein
VGTGALAALAGGGAGEEIEAGGADGSTVAHAGAAPRKSPTHHTLVRKITIAFSGTPLARSGPRARPGL